MRLVRCFQHLEPFRHHKRGVVWQHSPLAVTQMGHAGSLLTAYCPQLWGALAIFLIFAAGSFATTIAISYGATSSPRTRRKHAHREENGRLELNQEGKMGHTATGLVTALTLSTAALTGCATADVNSAVDAFVPLMNQQINTHRRRTAPAYIPPPAPVRRQVPTYSQPRDCPSGEYTSDGTCIAQSAQ